MNRIIQELQMSKAMDKEATTHDAAVSAAAAMLSFTRPEQPQQPPVAERDHHAEHNTPTAIKVKPEQKEDARGSTAKKIRRRASRNGFAPLTETEKRVKQRQLVKRSYYRKIVRH